MIDFTPELIAGIVGVGMSWLFGWFPVLRVWFAARKSEIKSLIIIGSLTLTSVAIYLLVYFGVLQTSTPITWWRLLTVLFVSTTLSQTTYLLTPQSRDVQEAKEENFYKEMG